ncbi:hypothetical protein BDV12DRAFT_184058 [Aspergillus spectabilis]
MAPRYSTVAVIGTGPAGISALKALYEEKTFDKIRVFERRDRAGGTWNYDPTPQKFPGTYPSISDTPTQPPSKFPQTTTPLIPLMAFTHTPLPDGNSEVSTERYGAGNPTRPYHVVARYLLDLVEKYREYISFNITVVTVEKIDSGKWRLTLRQPEVHGDVVSDSWWQEEFDAVIVATGQYNVPFVPESPGLEDTVKTHPEALEHVNAFRSQDHYAGKKVVVVGGSFSAGDVIGDIYTLVQGLLYVSQSSHFPLITQIWDLPNVEVKPTIDQIQGQSPSKLRITFSDGSQLEDVDKVIFATGYRLSFPFFSPDPILNPSLAAIGLVRAPLLFRMMEYEAVAVARYYAGRGGELPSEEEQERWEAEQLKLRDGYKFHEIPMEMKGHFDFFRDLAGPPAAETDGYELPEFAEEWSEKCLSVLLLKDEYWGRVRRGEVEVQV